MALKPPPHNDGGSTAHIHALTNAVADIQPRLDTAEKRLAAGRRIHSDFALAIRKKIRTDIAVVTKKTEEANRHIRRAYIGLTLVALGEVGLFISQVAR